jgi:2'-5' RNA ligase
MRLFCALDLPPEIVERLEKLVAGLRPLAPIQWSRPSNLHITTKFIGWWPDERFDELKAALSAIPPSPPLDVTIRGLGFYRNIKTPRVFLCGVAAPGLDALAAATETATTSLGIKAEPRQYSPHLTLARIKQPGDLQPLREAVAKIGPEEFGRFEARSFFLYQSQLQRGGSVYTKLAEFPLSH